MQTYQTSTITRRHIKRVENRLKGLSGWTDIFGSSSTTPPINGTSTNGSIGWDDFLGFLRGGYYKIEATQFAEGMNRIYYGMEPGCTDPVPNIPVVPNNSTPKFCATSVAGMIERCRTYEATNALNSIKTEFQRRMSNTSDPQAQYIARWWNEYGVGNDSRLRATISSAASVCGVTGDIPKLCTAPMIWSATQFKCVYPSDGQTSGGTTTMIMVGVLAVAAMFLLRR